MSSYIFLGTMQDDAATAPPMPASQLLVAVGVGGASKHVAVVRPRVSGGVGQTLGKLLPTWLFCNLPSDLQWPKVDRMVEAFFRLLQCDASRLAIVGDENEAFSIPQLAPCFDLQNVAMELPKPFLPHWL